jgi:hypothetical protein
MLIYDLRFLGGGPGFDELAHYHSFEQVIHYAFDGLFSKAEKECFDNWRDMVHDCVVDHIAGAANRDSTLNDELIADGVVSLYINYIEWLTRFVFFKPESIHTCVQLVTLINNDVYVHCENMELSNESLSESDEIATHHPAFLHLRYGG